MRKVLIVEDHDASRLDLVTALTESGFQVVGEAMNIALGNVLASNAAVDMILMAAGLRYLDGNQASQTIHLAEK
jgi:DNA-binding NarL/FixJ family response regulator